METILEEGVVISCQNGMALIEAANPGGCSACAIHASCGGASSGGRREIYVNTQIDLAPGERVVFEVKGGVAIPSLIYLFPVLMLFAGMYAGSLISLFHDPEAMMIIGALVMFCISWILIRVLNGFFAGKFQARVIRKIRQSEAEKKIVVEK